MSLHVEASAAVAETNPYLEGAYAATHDEVTLRGLEVLDGRIPDDLNGVYVRNGPNPQHHPVGRYHWFDGDGMVHSVHFADGEATYRNRWVRTEGFLAERDAGRAIWRGIIEPFGANPPDAPEKDTANTDLVFHRDRLIALWYRAGQAVRARPRDARDARPGGLRRDAALRGLRAREGRRAHRRADVLRLRREAALHAIRRRRARGDGAPLRADRPARPAAAPRHGDHRAPLDPDGPAAGRRSRGRRSRDVTSCSSSATCRRGSA